MENPNWGTITECAKHFGITRQRVHQMVVAGQLGQCEKMKFMGAPRQGDIWLIPKPFRRTIKNT